MSAHCAAAPPGVIPGATRMLPLPQSSLAAGSGASSGRGATPIQTCSSPGHLPALTTPAHCCRNAVRCTLLFLHFSTALPGRGRLPGPPRASVAPGKARSPGAPAHRLKPLPRLDLGQGLHHRAVLLAQDVAHLGGGSSMLEGQAFVFFRVPSHLYMLSRNTSPPEMDTAAPPSPCNLCPPW